MGLFRSGGDCLDLMEILGTRSASSGFTFIYLYTYLYVLCNLDPGCLYIYALCVYFFFFFEKILHIIWIWDFFKSFNLFFLYVTNCIA